MGKEALAQAAGLSPTAEEMTPRYYSSAVSLAAVDPSIGQSFGTGPEGTPSVPIEFGIAHPYGYMAQQYNMNQYELTMKERGFGGAA